ncbi:MAG: hypothetical protein KJO18_08495 [Acidimicrobiia bacterium]|nr:hypothetical protein [Acidimicrobiia bacterium]
MNFFGVAGRDELAAINDFITTLDVGSFKHAVDDDGTLWSSYGITTQPSFIFMDDSGDMTTHVGALGLEGLSDQLSALAS